MSSPVTKVSAADEQHMLFLFFPLKKNTAKPALQHVHDLQHASKALLTAGPDPRALTGVHFFMFYHLPADTNPGLPVTSFQTMPGKDMLVVMSIYDADFAPYIGSFVNNPDIAKGLNLILSLMDETNIPGVDPNGPTSANYIMAHGGVVKNPAAFNCLLMRYNFADPTIAAGSSSPTNKYNLGGTFPGLTIAKILQNYPDAETLWPLPAPTITFAPSFKPQCP